MTFTEEMKQNCIFETYAFLDTPQKGKPNGEHKNIQVFIKEHLIIKLKKKKLEKVRKKLNSQNIACNNVYTYYALN